MAARRAARNQSPPALLTKSVRNSRCSEMKLMLCSGIDHLGRSGRAGPVSMIAGLSGRTSARIGAVRSMSEFGPEFTPRCTTQVDPARTRAARGSSVLGKGAAAPVGAEHQPASSVSEMRGTTGRSRRVTTESATPWNCRRVFTILSVRLCAVTRAEQCVGKDQQRHVRRV
jgi:hypothetical protein